MLTHYIIVRRDLPLGVMAAMVTHAAGESASKRLWPLDSNTRAVVLGVHDQAELMRAARKLRKHGIDAVEIDETSGDFAGQFMAIGLHPCDHEQVVDVLREFQILKTLIDKEKAVVLP